jgi:GNAT superfamily N-acetyltransferase
VIDGTPDLEIALVDVADTYPLRRSVLRVGMPHVPVENSEDSVPGAFHLGARPIGGGPCMAVASFAPQETPWRPGRRAYRLRGMAVDPKLRSTGIGRRLLAAGADRVRALGAEVLWANARSTALPFYQRFGMAPAGEEFLEIGIPHRVVVLDL